MKSAEIRQKFLNFFKEKGHTIVRSSSLVPANDPTLMLTNAGMVQFKDVFLGLDKRPYTRATSCQRCVRAGGKHNDLENVGYTARHHTFFEMLGNFSFGDYFKRDAISFAWELLTTVYRLPKEKLWVTVYQEDDEAYDIWSKEIGVPEDRIVRIGDNKGARYASDNFWQMADTGPCGPCSEIFYDHGPDVAGGPPGSPDEDGDRYIEIWNLVFMQFNRDEQGNMTPLPKPCVDTGMGIERLAAIMQHVHSNYEIDTFQHLIKAAARAVGTNDLSQNSLKVIADHIRSTAFMIVDGLIPGSDGHGYVLRRIIRRALRHGYKLGQTKPFFYTLVDDLIKEMGEAYPELVEAADHVKDVLRHEEERFGETLDNGMKMLESALSAGGDQLSGETAFTLYDTYGFPLDLTADICRERQISVDEEGFNAAMEKQKEAARASGKFKMAAILDYEGDKTQFVGYDKLAEKGVVVALYREGVPVTQLEKGQHGVIVLNTTPFYAEMGGQVGDTGTLSAENVSIEVTDTQRIKPGVSGHHATVLQGAVSVGDELMASVNVKRRKQIARHHSVTHLMHKALRQVLGSHVAQRGSLVDPDKTRFDFSHNAPVTAEQIRQIEEIVNQEILDNRPTHTEEMSYDEAIAHGATALFGEKYGDIVRVCDIGTSCELCGGTHVSSTGDIGCFKIISESGIAAGIRRIEAVAGLTAMHWVQDLAQSVNDAAVALKTQPDNVVDRINQLQEHLKELDRELAGVKAKLASNQGDRLLDQAVEVNGLKVLVSRIDGADIPALRNMMDKLKDKLKTAAIVLATVKNEKVNLIAGVTADSISKIKAGELVNFVAAQVGGKGGGRPDMAQAGGTKPEFLAAALASVKDWIAQKLAS